MNQTVEQFTSEIAQGQFESGRYDSVERARQDAQVLLKEAGFTNREAILPEAEILRLKPLLPQRLGDPQVIIAKILERHEGRAVKEIHDIIPNGYCVEFLLSGTELNHEQIPGRLTFPSERQSLAFSMNAILWYKRQFGSTCESNNFSSAEASIRWKA